MSTMYQPPLSSFQGTMGGYQPSFQQGGYQPSFGIGQPSPDDVQKLIPILGPILATVIPAVVPPIVNSIFNQQKSLGLGVGSFQQTSPEDVQKILPVLGPVLASVIPAILPTIINSVLAQQKAMTPWGSQAFGIGQYGSQPQFGWGGQVPGQDLTQTVNEALRRVGIPTQAFGQQPFYGQNPAFAGRF
jgi:hypothetical protein